MWAPATRSEELGGGAILNSDFWILTTDDSRLPRKRRSDYSPGVGASSSSGAPWSGTGVIPECMVQYVVGSVPGS